MANRRIYNHMVSVVCMNCHEVLIPRYRRRLSDIGDPITRCRRCGGHAYNPILREAAMLSPEHIKTRQRNETLRIMALFVVIGLFFASVFSGQPFARYLPLLFAVGSLALKPWDFSKQLEESMERLKSNPGRAEEIESYGQQEIEEGSAWDLYRNSHPELLSEPEASAEESQDSCNS